MSLAIQKAPLFIVDFERQYAWYVQEASRQIADRHLVAVDQTLRALAIHPAIGRIRRFRHLELKGMRSFPVTPPFHRHLIFYRVDAGTLSPTGSSTARVICHGK